MSKEVFEVFVTKYALTSGIYKIKATAAYSEGMIIQVEPKPDSITLFYGDDWHRDFASAQKRATEMRDKRVKSLEQQIKRINALDFTEEPKL